MSLISVCQHVWLSGEINITTEKEDSGTEDIDFRILHWFLKLNLFIL